VSSGNFPSLVAAAVSAESFLTVLLIDSRRYRPVSVHFLPHATQNRLTLRLTSRFLGRGHRTEGRATGVTA